jgi:hypothetical protein
MELYIMNAQTNLNPMIMEPPKESIFSGKNIIILILVFFLILAFLGINILTIAVNFFRPFLGNTISAIGYSSGTIINDGADVIANVAKGGIDIADGVAHSIGDLLKNGKPAPDLAKTVNKGPSPKYNEPSPDKTTSPIQQPIATTKQNWCLIGDFNGQRGCVAVEDADKCMSGQIFPTQQLCLNPTFTQKNPYG